MSTIKKIFSFIFVSFLLLAPASAVELSTEEKINLQSTMYQFIEKVAVEDVITHVDLTTGNTIELVPVKAHPMILGFDEKFVLCTDFMDSTGKELDVDFYIERAGSNFNVFRMEIDNRAPLKKLMASGKVYRIK